MPKSDTADVAKEGFETLLAGEHRAAVDIQNEALVGLSNIFTR